MLRKLPLLFLVAFLTINLQAQTWSKITIPTTASISSCFFVNENLGWMITYNTIYKTTDGGISWTIQNHPHYVTPIEENFFRVQFINENVGIIAVGNYVFVNGNTAEASSVLWTTNGGATWTYKDIGAVLMNEPDIRLVNENTAYCFGDYGVGRKTADGGTTWNTITYDTDVAVQKLIPIDENTLYFVGAKGNLGTTLGAFGATSDGGDSWNIATVSSNESIESIYFEDALHGWIGGYNGEIKSTADAGANWNSCNTGVNAIIKDIVFTDDSKGWAVTSDGKVIHSSDGGLNWIEEYSGLHSLNAISFTKPNHIGFAVGDQGTLLKYNPNLANENPALLDFGLYPNPVKNNLVLDFKTRIGSGSVNIYNALGQLVQNVNKPDSGNSINIDVSALKTGTYFIEVHSEKGKTTKKFVKL